MERAQQAAGRGAGCLASAFLSPLHFVLPGVQTPLVPNHKPHPAAVTAGGDTESPAQHLQASAVMRISPHTTPKPTCKAEFPRGKKTYAQAAHIPPQTPLSHLRSHLLIFPPSWAERPKKPKLP